MILEQDPGKIATNFDKFDKLITALRTVVDNDGVLDKESTSYNDIFASRIFCTVIVMLPSSVNLIALFKFAKT